MGLLACYNMFDSIYFNKVKIVFKSTTIIIVFLNLTKNYVSWYYCNNGVM